mgnify:FL=1
MSNEQKKGDKPNNQNSTPNPFDNKKPKGQKSKFNPIWIYAILAVAFLGLTFLNPGSGTKKSTGEVLKMIQSGDVAKIKVVNRSRAEIYLTEDAKKASDYKKDVSTSRFGSTDLSPTYFLSDIGPEDKFDEKLRNMLEG